jgi:hypothetical protein
MDEVHEGSVIGEIVNTIIQKFRSHCEAGSGIGVVRSDVTLSHL